MRHNILCSDEVCFSLCATDGLKTVCQAPQDMEGRWLAELGMQLRMECHQSLGYQDYLFLTSVGFIIFSAGTMSAWVTGVLMVLYERCTKNANMKPEGEDEGAGGDTPRNGDLSKPGEKV